MTNAGLSLLAIAAALLLLAVVLQDAFEVMLLPRRVRRRVRVMSLFFQLSWSVWTTLARRLAEGRRREGFLSHFGAMSMLLLFTIWAAGLITGFGMIEWALQAPSAASPSSPLGEQVYMSGVTFFTLGYGDVVPHTAAARFVAVVEAGTGIGFIAVVIGYLPVLYQLFSRREAHVIQLDARAGSPPSAATMLARHADPGGLENLDGLLREWEVWGSELLESHLSYPMLAYYRSQHDNQSWLAAIACIMDTCALVLVGVHDMHPIQARMTFAIGRLVLIEMAQSFHVQPSRYDGGDRLDPEAYTSLEAALAEAGVAWDGGETSRDTLAALRATYEPLLDGLSKHLLLPLPTWLPGEGSGDHWERGHRGLIASRLIEQLSSREPSPDPLPENRSRGWRDLRRRLRAESAPAEPSALSPVKLRSD